MPADAVFEIGAGLFCEPGFEAFDGCGQVAGGVQFVEWMGIDAANDAAAGKFARHDDPVRDAANGNEHAVAEGNGSGQAIKALAHPIKIAIEEGACFFDAALDGQGDNDGAARAANAKREAPRGRMVADFDWRTDAICLPLRERRHVRHFRLAH